MGAGSFRHSPAEVPVKQLIVNADDYGYTAGVNRAILDAYRVGIVTSTSLLANGAAFETAVEQARREPGLDIGCHLNFVEGSPVSPWREIPHLVRPDGTFHSTFGLAGRLLYGAIPTKELERETQAQIEKLLRAGIRPTHVDTHKHTHLHPQVASVLGRVAREFGIGWLRRPWENCTPEPLQGVRLRQFTSKLLTRWFSGWEPRWEQRAALHPVRMPDFFVGFALTGRLTQAALESILGILRPGLTELMCHPAYCDEDLAHAPTRLKHQREVERETVMDGAWRNYLADRNIALTNFSRASVEAIRSNGGPVLLSADPNGRSL